MRLRYPRFSVWFGASALAIGLAVPRSALAGDSAAADVLFEQAKALAQEGKLAEACPKFEASYKLDRTLGALLNMADCHERIGRIASAWAEWGEAVDFARRSADSREGYASDRREALTPRLPKLTIRVNHPRPGLDVVRDGVVLDPATFGVALPVDPGEHVIVIQRGAQRLKEERVKVAERGAVTVDLDLETIEEAAPAPPPRSAPVGPAAPSTSPLRTTGFVAGGVGIAALLVAGVLEALAIAGKPGRDACKDNICTPAGFDQATRARTHATIGQWLGISGMALTAVGISLVLATSASGPPSAAMLAPPRKPRSAAPPPGVWVSAWAAPSAGGLTVGGRL